MLKYKIVIRKNPSTREKKYHAQLIPVTPVYIEQLAEAISAKCTVTRADVKAVLAALEEQIVQNLQSGNSVRLGDLGSFHPTISTKSANSFEEFTPQNIQRVNVRFRRSAKMAYALSTSNPNVVFKCVSEAPVEEGETA